jgi:hypothetical protein
MDIQINTPDELLCFVNRKDVSTKNAIDVFGKCFKVKNIIFIDAITKEISIDKNKAIEKIESFVNDVKDGKRYNKIVLF